MKLENALQIIHGFRIIAFLAGVRSTPCKTENLIYPTMIGENSHTFSHGKSLTFHLKQILAITDVHEILAKV